MPLPDEAKQTIQFDFPQTAPADARHYLTVVQGGLERSVAVPIEALVLGPVVFVGLSVGGMIGQHLASARPDLVPLVAVLAGFPARYLLGSQLHVVTNAEGETF